MRGGIRGSGLKRRQGGQSSISRRLVRDPEESVIESRIFADFRGGSFGHGFSRAAAGTAQYTAWQPGPQAPPVEGTVVGGCVAAVPMPVRFSHRKLCVLFGTRCTASRRYSAEGPRGDRSLSLAGDPPPPQPTADRNLMRYLRVGGR